MSESKARSEHGDRGQHGPGDGARDHRGEQSAGNSGASDAHLGAADAIAFLQSFDLDGWHNLVAFDPIIGGKPIDARTFPPHGWGRKARWIGEQIAADRNVYFSVNEPRSDAPPGKLQKIHIGRIRAVYADVDPEGGAEELESERARIKGTMADLMNEPVPPSFVIDSGGGFQPFWKVEPVEADAANVQLAEGIGKHLAELLGGDPVQNIDRIMRLPGTSNHPDAKKRRKGRAKRRATVLFTVATAYTLEQLAEEFEPPQAERTAKEGTGDDWSKYASEIDIDAVRACKDISDVPGDLLDRFEAALKRWPKLAALWRGEKDGGKDRSGSGMVMSLAFHLFNRGFSLMDFAHLAWHWGFAAGNSGRDVNAGPRSLAKAWAKAAGQQQKGDNPYFGMSFAALLAAALAIDMRGDAAADASAEDRAKAASAAAARMRVVRRQIIAAGVRLRLQPDEVEELLQALKQSTRTGIGILHQLWKAAKDAERRAERERAAEAGGDAPIGGDWEEALQRDRKGIIANVHNAIVILRSPNFADMIDFDELQAAAMLRRAVPETGRQPPADFRAHMLNDIDLTVIQARLQRLWVPSIGRNVVAEAIEPVARDNSFHPIRDWLDGITWDETPRLDNWLTTYLGAEAQESHSEAYLREIGPKFLIAMVARVYRPGCKVDYMLMLEGGQGSIKSTACRVLAGDAFFSDALRDITSKDASQHLRGLWLIEIAELEAMSKAESTAMKAFITRRTERYRPPYGRKEVIEPRQCVFIGTTNEHAYLKDATGNRRFWPAAVGTIDINALGRDREQLFAEAAVRFHAGQPWWPNPVVEARLIQPVQKSRYADDLWRAPIEVWLDGLGTNDASLAFVDGSFVRVPDAKRADVRKDSVTVYDIARYALGRQNEHMTQRDRLRIVEVLTAIGWVYSHKSHGLAAYRRAACGEDAQREHNTGEAAE